MDTTIGVRIRNLRRAANLTQEELGYKVGVTKATINKYETGIVVNLRRPVIDALARELGTSPAYLMGWDENLTMVGNVGTNNGVVGQNYGEVHAVSLSKQEEELLRIFRGLSARAQMELMTTVFRMEEENK